MINQYEMVGRLGQGSYGLVMKCIYKGKAKQLGSNSHDNSRDGLRKLDLDDTTLNNKTSVPADTNEEIVEVEYAAKIITRSQFRGSLTLKQQEEEKKVKDTAAAKALDTTKGEEVKTVPQNLKGMDQEMQCLTKLNHKNIIKLKEIIDDPTSKKVYLIMNYCKGGTLLSKLKKTESGIEESLAKHYFRSLLSAIHYCLEVHNMSHRDIKPENIMLDEDGEVFLCDFGCSEFFEQTNEKLSKATKGTYLFMAPEMFEKDATKKVLKGRATDIWAAGVTLFNLLTKDHPFKGKNVWHMVVFH